MIPPPMPKLRVLSSLIMAHARAGRSETARTWLSRAVAALGPPNRPGPSGSHDSLLPPWEVEVEHFRREAEALILTPNFLDDPFAP
jgi:hypothetical protein